MNMVSSNYTCDCGHLSSFYSECTHCNQSICQDCMIGNVCQLCIEFNRSINHLCNFIEYNIPILEQFEYNSYKYNEYKRILENLITIYNSIISGQSIYIEDELYHSTIDPEHISKLLEDSYYELLAIINESDYINAAE